ncbi:MAG: Gfo/Idh/MocA family oxidoreductase [Ruminococcaceae bacterium]|nr:Gfo/Idh/MocA family oxidoreductase [Oscillospiraceae bacterium]
MGKKRRIAILGCGGMGSGHALAIGGKGGYTTDFLTYNAYGTGQIEITELDKKLELAGIYDIDDERMEWVKEMGWHCYKDYDDMLADPTVDIVLICVPNDIHHDLSIKAMRAGKHILCEKPVMMTSAELENVIKVSKETGMVFYPRHNRRWDMDYLMIKKIYDEGLIGNVFNVETRYMGSRGIPGDWRAKKEFGGGMMLDWGVHLLDRILMMIPEKIKSVYCQLTHITNDECDDGFKVLLTFESGITALVEVGTCNFLSLPFWYICGDKGTAYINDFRCEGRMMLLKEWYEEGVKPVLAGEGLTKTMAPRDDKTIEEVPLPEVVVDRNALYANLVDTINGEAEQIVTAEEALRVLRLMEACFESDRLNNTVAFE